MGDLIREEHALALLEAPGGDGPFNPDGTVNVVLIRPCDGRGPGGRIYTREVLEAAAPAFTGWPSYLNHLDPAAARKAAMRRGPDELAGEIREASWDPAYTGPDDGRYGYEPGAVVGRFMPATDLVEQLLRRIPRQLKLSIKAQATALRRGSRKDGSSGWLVEGIENDPENSSFDLVTGAGAGGEVLALVESSPAAPPPSVRNRRPVPAAPSLRASRQALALLESMTAVTDPDDEDESDRRLEEVPGRTDAARFLDRLLETPGPTEESDRALLMEADADSWRGAARNAGLDPAALWEQVKP